MFNESCKKSIIAGNIALQNNPELTLNHSSYFIYRFERGYINDLLCAGKFSSQFKKMNFSRINSIL